MKHLIKKAILFLGLLVITYACQKDDSFKQEKEQSTVSIKAFNLTAEKIPAHILNYIGTKTNHTFRVNIEKKHIKLSNTPINAQFRETPLGIVQTNKVVQVYNEQNIKYTFKVSDPNNAESTINLIVVDMGEEIIEYFIQYIFDPNIAKPLTEDGIIDMSRFTGVMLFYNNEGETIGTYILNEGDVLTSTGVTEPCDEEDVDDDQNSDGTQTGGSGAPDDDPSNPDDNGYDNSSGYNPGNSGAGEYANPDASDNCTVGLHWVCENGLEKPHDGSEHACTGGNLNGYGSWVFKDCDGVTYSTGSNRMYSPCEGEVGVLIIDDEEDEVDDCMKLKEDITDQPIIKTRLHSMKVDSEFLEKGLRIDVDPNTGEYSPSEVLNNDNGEGHIKIDPNPYTVVVVHTHPEDNDDYYDMFSGSDIIKMGEITKYVQSGFNPVVNPVEITHILIVNGKTFALRFDDEASVQFLLDIYENVNLRSDFINDLHYAYDSDKGGPPTFQTTTTIFKQQRHIYNLFSKYNLNMSLYEANYDENNRIDNWQKINKETLQKDPCN